jgi:hypothetical protein
MGATKHPAFPAPSLEGRGSHPLLSEGKVRAELGRCLRRENAKLCSCEVIARLDRTTRYSGNADFRSKDRGVLDTRLFGA